jgi:glycine/D-amino acid oxidase-like deaminating enzyme/nitrite reductase/ring-hydroxylating ferredoxin subunit
MVQEAERNRPMKTDSGDSISLWMQTAVIPSRPALEQDAQADVCIVGGGMAGLSTAYLLAREGKSVVVVDDGLIGGGATCRTTAHLSNAIDDSYTKIEKAHGAEGAQLAAESHSAAIDRIESNVADERIACDFERVDGYLFVPPDQKADILQAELQAAHRAGLTEVEFIERAPSLRVNTGQCLRFPRQGQFHPLKYLAGLLLAFESRGGRIYGGTHVTDVQGGDRAEVRTKSGMRITARAVVVATNTPVNDRVAIHTKQFPYRTYVIAARIGADAVVKALYWDTADPYHYVRRHHADGSEYLIVGGEDHKTGHADDAVQRYARLEAWAGERFSIGPVDFRWSGQVMESMDGLGFIGRNPLDDENVFIVTGDSGMGMTHGTIAGMLLTDLILGRPNRWSKLYDPSRVSLHGTMEFAKENVNVAAQYTAYLTPGEQSSIEDVAPGSGAVLREGLTKVAIYRDPSGQVYRLSAVCPHLACIVEWNSSEKTWDCPCHGSRFTAVGGVINGPANSDLPAA